MKIMCFGDSNTYGYDPRSSFGGRYSAENRWVDILSEKYGFNTINSGQNGLSIPSHEYDISLYSRIISRESPEMLCIMLGSNDLLQGYGAEAVSKRMERFIKGLNIDPVNILLLCPFPLSPGLWVDSEKYIEQSRLLSGYYRSLADTLGLHYADAGQWEIPLSYDGVHFTESGHRFFAEKLYEVINMVLED